jgi:hypothetical protein
MISNAVCLVLEQDLGSILLVTGIILFVCLIWLVLVDKVNARAMSHLGLLLLIGWLTLGKSLLLASF